MNPRDFSGLSYRIRRQEEGWYLELRVRYRRNGNEIVLWPEICEQIWELRGEMPTEVADLIPEGAWECHRLELLDLIGQALGHGETDTPRNGELF